jgi:hypothetical protein
VIVMMTLDWRKTLAVHLSADSVTDEDMERLDEELDGIAWDDLIRQRIKDSLPDLFEKYDVQVTET